MPIGARSSSLAQLIQSNSGSSVPVIARAKTDSSQPPAPEAVRSSRVLSALTGGILGAQQNQVSGQLTPTAGGTASPGGVGETGGAQAKKAAEVTSPTKETGIPTSNPETNPGTASGAASTDSMHIFDNNTTAGNMANNVIEGINPNVTALVKGGVNLIKGRGRNEGVQQKGWWSS